MWCGARLLKRKALMGGSEAYFDVTDQKSSSFVVNIDKSNIRNDKLRKVNCRIFHIFSSYTDSEVGQVSSDYPVPVGYCSTRHYPDPVGYYFKIWPDPGNLSRFLRLLTIPHAVKCKLGKKWAFVLRPSCMTLYRHAWLIIAQLELRRGGQMAVYRGAV